MTDVSTLYINVDGQPVINTWTDWEPTPELRFVRGAEVSVGPFPGSPARLQQRMVRLGFNSVGHLATKEYLWRDVPTVAADQ